ncbi:MAG: glycoside hydrolase family 130 protein [Bacteroidota bacterium]
MINRTNIRIEAKPERVIPLFLDMKEKERVDHIVSKVLLLNDITVDKLLTEVLEEFDSRHHNFKRAILKHFQNIESNISAGQTLSFSKKLLIGAYFTKEYSLESAALFNPSIIVHPNQGGLKHGEIRFIMSLRATGEGHISSIEFSTGIISEKGKISIDQQASHLICPNKVDDLKYPKHFVKKRAKSYNGFNYSLFDYLPDYFTKSEALQFIENLRNGHVTQFMATKEALDEIFDINYNLTFEEEIPINSKVIFPSSAAESKGMEDVRFVKFTDDGKSKYFGTYTAYNGHDIRVQIIETEDFNSFKIRSLYGTAVFGKGMALFPEKINGRYAMIGRQGGKCITIMYSNDIYHWDSYKIIQKPEREWEMTQLGNSGSPIKTPKGWLLLTHAVGPLRKYVISATLLDLHNPGIVIASLDKPLISPNSHERNGYVPNVVYTCGFLQHEDNLIIPYAMSDSITGFATVNLNELINELLKNKQVK